VSGTLLYVDASALVKLVVAEPESDALKDLLTARDDLVTSAVALVEVVRAARRASSSSAVLARAREVARAVHLLAVDLKILDRAGDLEPATLRTLDAIHLASALSLEADLEAMVVYDERLAAAAREAGIPVLAPR
jgi:predicted nucleic acid-binding protein